MTSQSGNQTDQALAQLYAHVQSMPESAHKRRLVSKLNEANGRGTPEVATSGSVRTIGKMARTRRKSGDGFINLLTPRRKRPVTGSYSVKSARSETLAHSQSFRRQNSLAVTPGPASAAQRTLSPGPQTQSSPAVLSPFRDRLPTPPETEQTPVSQASEVCAVDEVDTPGRDTGTDSEEEDLDSDDEDIPDHDGSYTEIAPPLPPRTPNPASVAAMSPITMAITTPRHRGGLMLSSRTQLDRWKNLLDSQQSPNQQNIEEEQEDGEMQEKRKGRERALSEEFKEFLSSQGMEAEEDQSVVSDTSLVGPGYSEEVRRLLTRDAALSTSLQAAMDGEEPEDEAKVLGEITNTEDSVSPVPRRGVKRRSITEAGPKTPSNVTSSVQNSAIVFETDL